MTKEFFKNEESVMDYIAVKEGTYVNENNYQSVGCSDDNVLYFEVIDCGDGEVQQYWDEWDKSKEDMAVDMESDFNAYLKRIRNEEGYDGMVRIRLMKYTLVPKYNGDEEPDTFVMDDSSMEVVKEIVSNNN